MPDSIITTKKFRIAFPVWCIAWAALHFVIVRNFGLDVTTALHDSIISNILLAVAALIAAVTLQFYIPSANKYVYLISLCAVLAALCIMAGKAILLALVSDDVSYQNFFTHSILIRGASGFLAIGCMALISVLWYTLQDQQQAEKRKTEADRLSREAELNTLRQQLQPHFLFNSLNSINALIAIQPQQARTMVQQLSNFLRGTLHKDQNAWTLLVDELQHLQLYLDIEKVRFGHRLTATINNQTKDAQLPAMLLQPLVENAIKFGLYDTVGDVTITINAITHDGFLQIEITNPFDAETATPAKGTGFGVSSVQRRLYLLFARQDLLQTSTTNNLFITRIKIPQP